MGEIPPSILVFSMNFYMDMKRKRTVLGGVKHEDNCRLEMPNIKSNCLNYMDGCVHTA